MTKNCIFVLQLEPGQELPPPSLLKRRILIKNKKKHHHHHHKKQHKKAQVKAQDTKEDQPEGENNGVLNQSTEGENGPVPDVIPQNDSVDSVGNGSDIQIGNGDVCHAPMLQQRQGSKDSTQEEEGIC